MSKHGAVLHRILQGNSDAGIAFDDLCQLMRRLGFAERTRGRYTTFRFDGVDEHINLQRDGNQAKPYQVRQVRAVILKYHLGADL